MEPAVEVYDHPLRFWVRSRKSSRRYLVDLQSYKGHGECDCPDFRKNLEKFLRNGHTPEYAVAMGWVTLSPRDLAEDALRCWHLRKARSFACDVHIRCISQAERLHTTTRP